MCHEDVVDRHLDCVLVLMRPQSQMCTLPPCAAWSACAVCATLDPSLFIFKKMYCNHRSATGVGGRDRCGARFHPGPDRRRPTRPGGRREAPGPRAPACPGVPGRGRERRELSELTDSMSSLVTQWVRRPAGVFTRRIGRAVLTKFMSHDGRSPSIKSASSFLAAWRGATRSTSSQSSLSSAMDALHASRQVGCFASI